MLQSQDITHCQVVGTPLHVTSSLDASGTLATGSMKLKFYFIIPPIRLVSGCACPVGSTLRAFHGSPCERRQGAAQQVRVELIGPREPAAQTFVGGAEHDYVE